MNCFKDFTGQNVFVGYTVTAWHPQQNVLKLWKVVKITEEHAELKPVPVDNRRKDTMTYLHNQVGLYQTYEEKREEINRLLSGPKNGWSY